MIDTDQYKTIVSPAEGLYKDKGSKFHGYIHQVTSIEDVEVVLAELRSIHPKARHACYAYRIGISDDIFRINDDGEPSGSAGRPIYNELLSNQLTDVLAVVVRYFGGTKLGIPGLIQAYRSAVQDSLTNTTIVTKYITQQVTMQYPVSDMGRLYDILKKMEVNDVDSRFTPIPHMLLQIRASQVEETIHLIKAAYLGYAPTDIPIGYKVESLKFQIGDEER